MTANMTSADVDQETTGTTAELRSVFVSAGLVLYTRKSAALAYEMTDEADIHCLATAALLTAAAAAEAILSESAYITNINRFTEPFLFASVEKK